MHQVAVGQPGQDVRVGQRDRKVGARFYRGPVGKSTTASEFSLDRVTMLPRVDIIMAARTWTAR